MLESIISEGRTTGEAIENGLAKLKVTRDKVEVNVIENTEKRSFFSILTPRVVKVELKLKQNIVNKDLQDKEKINKKTNNNTVNKIENIEDRAKKIEQFLEQLNSNFSENKFAYKVEINDNIIIVDISGDSIGNLIGHRGETLNSLQIILSSIANNNYDTKAKVILDIQGYREKRKEILENLAIKVSKTVLRTGKSITLEPMSAYERKIIHDKLQENKNVYTHSIGEEPHRRVVISKNN